MSTTTNRRRRTPEEEKGLALRHAGRLAAKADTTERDRDNAMLFAAEAGASLREIEAATGVPYATVRRIIGRVRASAE